MDAQFNSPIGFLILEELKWIRKDLKEEMKSITKEIINLGYKLNCSQSDNLNTAKHYNDCQEKLACSRSDHLNTNEYSNDDHGENVDIDHFSEIKLEYFGNTDENLQPQFFDDKNNISNKDDNGSEEIKDLPKNDYNIPNTEQSNLNWVKPTSETISQHFELREKCLPEIKMNVTDFNNELVKLESKKTTINNTNSSINLMNNINRLNDLSYVEKFHHKKHICKYCNKGFNNLTNLTGHLRIHTGEKPFKCKHCGKDFTLLGHLKNHTRLHTGEKYFCSYCSKGYTQYSGLKIHVLKWHKK